MKNYKPNKSIREKFPIKQEDFAAYLGVSRSLVNMFEQGLRSLPTPALLKLAKLEMLHYGMIQQKVKKHKVKAAHPEIQKHHKKTIKDMELHSELCKYKKDMLQYELNNMIAEHSKAETWIQILEDLLTDTQNNKENKRDREWIEIQQHNTIKKLIRNGSASQVKLQAMIETLAIEEQAHKKWSAMI